MPLILSSYDPDRDLRERAARAVQNFNREYEAVKDPGVTADNDLVDRTSAARARWLATPAGKEHLRRQKEVKRGAERRSPR